ncbi:GatB/YqeY domain-containing protein [bacterium]|nr:GatB/YqeY domain-containing protein [bacterium]
MGIQETLIRDMKSSMKSKDKVALETIRMLRAQIKNESLKRGQELSDDDVIKVLIKEAKKRKEALDLYQKGGREDLADKETYELKIIDSYLPKRLTQQELEKIVDQTIREAKGESLRDMGKVMQIIMPQVTGRADGKTIQELVKKKLG